MNGGSQNVDRIINHAAVFYENTRNGFCKGTEIPGTVMELGPVGRGLDNVKEGNRFTIISYTQIICGR